MEDSSSISEEIAAMRRLLSTWVANPESQSSDLLNWLQGYGLPVSESGEEPYVWVLRGLPLNHERAEARRSLARRVAAALREQPDIQLLGRRPAQILYNLLMLATGLAWPEELAAPLYEMYGRSELSGRYLGLDLRGALRSALVENQLDSRLEREWFAMLEGSREVRLPGNPFQGYYGVLLMPSSNAGRGRPNLHALGKALKLMAHYLERRDDRWQSFEALRDKVKIYGDSLPYKELLLQSQEHRWPAWAVLALLSLVTLIDNGTSELKGFVWTPLLGELPQECEYQVIDTYYDSTVKKVRAPERTWKLLLEIKSTVEPIIRKAPYSYGFGALHEAFNHVDTEQLLATA